MRKSDATLGWSFREFIYDPNHDPMWLTNIVMVKAAAQCIKATEEFLETRGIIKTNGWVISGASKRGWTALLLGSANQTISGVKVVGLAPLVPIMPDLKKAIHRQWQSYGGYSWAFKDYMNTGICHDMDGEEMEEVYKIVDPLSYMDRLEGIPKLIIMSSDDEFMQFDWTNIWYDQMKGESHLQIVANSEHTMITGIMPSLTSIGSFVRSIASGITSRPTFAYNYD